MSDRVYVGDSNIYGERLGPVSEPHGTIGSIRMIGQVATPERVQAAARFWREIKAGDLGHRDGHLYDKGSGAVYAPVLYDPLASQDPRATPVTMFTVQDDTLVFLERSSQPARIDEIDEIEQASAERDAAYERDHTRFLERQRQTPILHGEADGLTPPSLRDCARQILDSGGRIEIGKWGELQISIPELIHQDPIVRALSAADTRRQLAACAETLVRAERVVLAALQARDGKKARLDEILPPGHATVGGGIA